MRTRALLLFTIGHSTRSADELVHLLEENGVRALVDVRRYPASRRNPQFNRDALTATLGAAGIEYVGLPELGGRRTPRKHSRNTAWRTAGFRGYADYMETEPFRLAAARLMEMGGARRTAFMCAEQAWQQCHRGLISDYLKAHGWEVRHILGTRQTEVHPGTAAARFVDGQLSYREEQAEQTGFGF